MDYANLEKAKKEERLKVYADALETFWPHFPDLAPVDRDIIDIIKQASTVQVEICKVLLQQAPPDCLLLESDEADRKLDFVATTFSVGPVARHILTRKIDKLRQRIKDAKE